MTLTLATSSAHPERGNEDFVAAGPGTVVLVDGAGISGVEDLCHHGVAWYAARLGATLLARLSNGAGTELTMVLASAIDEVTDRHRDTCQVADPSSPSATVAMVRSSGGQLDHLLLGDSVIVLDAVDGSATVVEDRREVEIARPLRAALAALEPGTPDHDRARSEAITTFRARRNQPGGFFVAKDDGRVAAEALTGSRPTEELRGVVLMSNGASRVVDRFGLLPWSQVSASEPDRLIAMVRDAERATGVEPDDATVARWHL